MAAHVHFYCDHGCGSSTYGGDFQSGALGGCDREHCPLNNGGWHKMVPVLLSVIANEGGLVGARGNGAMREISLIIKTKTRNGFIKMKYRESDDSHSIYDDMRHMYCNHEFILEKNNEHLYWNSSFISAGRNKHVICIKKKRDVGYGTLGLMEDIPVIKEIRRRRREESQKKEREKGRPIKGQSDKMPSCCLVRFTVAMIQR